MNRVVAIALSIAILTAFVGLAHLSTAHFISRCDSALTRGDMPASERLNCLETAFEIAKWQRRP